MKANRETDELLCSFIDGELPLRQQTEVQRLAARDPEVAERLRQLQNSKNLVNALPRTEAPALMLEQIKQSLERRTLLEERPVLTGTRAGARHLRVRRFVATAAMIALLGGLGVVVYQIVAPVSPTDVSGPMVATTNPATPTEVTPVVEAGSGFSGRLELHTASFAQADGFIKRTLEQNGLSERSEAEAITGGRIYHIESSPEGLNRLVADLGTNWQNFASASLAVDTERFGDPVVLESVTFQQTAKIVSQGDADACVAVAQEVAAMNVFDRDLPGQGFPSGNDAIGSSIPLPAIPRPVLTSPDPENEKTTTTIPEGTVKASLTIVLLNTQ